MIRAYLYLIAAGIIWIGEGAVFSSRLGLAPWQVVLLAVMYVALYGVVVRQFLHGLKLSGDNTHEYPAWRLVSLAPMLSVVLGSFVSLPLLLLVVALGKIV